MKTIAELKRDKITLRLSNPLQASVSELIVDVATKLAKEENREVVEADVTTAIKRLIKQNEGAIELIKSKNGDYSKWEKEINVLKEFLPKQLTQEEINVTIDNILNTLKEEERVKKNMGRVMNELKKYDNIDMNYASKILKEKLI